MKINKKTFAGIGLGLIAGYFIFKNNNNKLLYIGATGLAGGLLANLVLNKENKNTDSVPDKKLVEDLEKEVFDEFEGDISIQQVPTVKPLTTPISTKEMFDIDLGFTR